MYKLFTANSKSEKRLKEYLSTRQDVTEKLDKLKINHRRAIGAHPLHGRLNGKWSCWLGANIRMIYSIDDKESAIVIEAVGSHKIY